MADFIFIALSIFAISGAIAMLINQSPIYSALGLLVTMLAIAGLFALLNAAFLFMVQTIVYAGAIMTLILFILMFLNIKEEELPKEPKKYLFIGLGVVLMAPLNLLILKAVAKLPDANMNIVEGDFGGIKPLGLALYNDWLLAFELISILLLVALVGAIVLAKRRKPKESKGEQL